MHVVEGRTCLCVPLLKEGPGAFELFVEGDDLYEAMIAAIEAARKSVRLESYIFEADRIGWLFAKALSNRARSGVDVRFHFDSYGASYRPSPQLWGELESSGVRLRWYHPWRWYHPSRYFQRNHRKLLVIDDEEAFLGGFNIALENSRALFGEGRTRDTHVRVRGELAPCAAALFDQLWEGSAMPHLDGIPEDASGFSALLMPNFSRRCQRRLACIYAGLIAASRNYVYLTSPYFCPGTVVGKALRSAATRGVDVRLLVPRNSDPSRAGWATRYAYARLLPAGVRIFEYLPRKLHAKTAVIDNEWAIVGSANLDYLSLFVNHELVLMARNRELNEALRRQYLLDLEDASEVSASRWDRRGRGERCLEWIGWAIRRLL